jgi:hypothetical protein
MNLYLLAGSSRSPGDVYVPCDYDDLPLASDVTVTSPVSATSLPRENIVAGHAAQAAESRKHLQNDEICTRSGLCFLPHAVETFDG